MVQQDVTVEIAVGDGWTDISQFVRDTEEIEVTYGQPDEASSADPATCRLRLHDPDARFAPDNPTGPWFGRLGRNTPLRTSLGVPVSQAFPAVAAAGTPHTTGSDGTEKTVAFPAHSAGARLLLIMAVDGDTDIVSITNVGSDTWTQVRSLRATPDDPQATLHIYEIKARTSSSTGGFVTVTLSAAETAAARVYAITGHDQTRPAAASLGSESDGNTPDPDGLAAPWGIASTLWLAITEWDGDTPDVTSFPAGYGSGEEHQALNSGRGAGFAIASRQAEVASEDPGAFTLDAMEETAALTVAVPPATQPLTRFTGEVPSWPPRHNPVNTVIDVPIEASGILRRLGQDDPIGSVYRRHITSLDGNQAPVAYWSCEDTGEQLGRVGSSVDGVDGLKVFRPYPDFAVNSDFAGSEPVLVMRGGELRGDVPPVPGGATGVIHLRFLVGIPSGGLAANTLICTMRTSGSLFSWQFIQAADNQFTLRVFNPGGDLVDETTGLTFSGMPISGRPVLMYVTTRIVDSTVEWRWGMVDTDTGEHRRHLGAIAGSGQRATEVRFGTGAQPLDGVAIGHVSVHAQSVPTGIPSGAGGRRRPVAVNAYKGEPAGRRIERLCAEESIPLATIGDLDQTELLGPQRPGTLLELLQKAAAADLGILCEAVGLCYRTRESLYNQPAKVMLSFNDELAGSLESEPDDSGIANDVTVSREGGGSRRAVQTTGPLSVSPPPDGVGRYPDSVTISVLDDERLGPQAEWRLHLGTVADARFPQVAAQLFTPDVAAIAAAVNTLELGDRLVITDTPPWLAPGDISLLVVGWSETVSNFAREITFNCTPETPWQVGVWEQSRFDTDGSQLANSISDTAVSFSVATLTGELWTTDGAQFPLDVELGGERMTVTNISGSSSPQTFAVTRSVNGVVKPHPAATPVRLAASEAAVVSL